uniref:Uncharacterized protein n=1 Tax=uncultured bacterium contig00259 TaxID=1181615 RepID=A0A806K1Y8_9BACT|nr:hypothetical protein [uncultured bacterium contig00259]
MVNQIGKRGAEKQSREVLNLIKIQNEWSAFRNGFTNFRLK